LELSKLRTVNWGTGSLKHWTSGPSFDPGFFQVPRTGGSLILISFSSTRNWQFFDSDFFSPNAQNWWCLEKFKEQLLPHWDVPFIFCRSHKQAKTDLFKKATDYVHGKQIIF
jgi:hypothetical protein